MSIQVQPTKKRYLRRSEIDPAHRDAMLETTFRKAQAAATDKEIADELNLTVDQLYHLRAHDPAFNEAMRAGKELPNERAGRSMYQQALGGYVREEQAIKVKFETIEGSGRDKVVTKGEKVEKIDVIRYIPPNTVAAIFWLKNRDPQNWRDVNQVDIRTPDAAGLDLTTLALSMLRLLTEGAQQTVKTIEHKESDMAGGGQK